jgi:hypothetical protein
MEIQEVRLAEYIRVHPATVRGWRKAGDMPPHIYEAVPRLGGQQILYRFEDVNTWLMKLCRNVSDGLTPTIESLLERRTRLLKTREVLKRLNVHHAISESGLYVHRDAELWPILLLPGGAEYRYFASHIDALAQPIPETITYTIRDIRHIFGIGRTEAFRFVEEGKLVILPASGGTPKRVTRQSVIELLRECLPTGRNPYIWLNARLNSSEPMASPNALAVMLDKLPYKIRQMAEREQIPSLLIRNRERRIPLDALPRIRALLAQPNSQ